jgi:hypothetical protein
MMTTLPASADPVCDLRNPSERKDCCNMPENQGGPARNSSDYQQYCPGQPKTEPPDHCKPAGAGSELQVYAKVSNPLHPVADLTKSSGDLRAMHPGERVSGVRTGETAHVDGQGRRTSDPFSILGSLHWAPVYSSTRGQHSCLALESIDFPYNPLRIFVAADFQACVEPILEHETLHYQYIDALDTRFAEQLPDAIRQVDLPTRGKPQMVTRGSEDAAKLGAQVRVATKMNQLLSGDYLRLYNQHKQLDSDETYQQICHSCRNWPIGICNTRR